MRLSEIVSGISPTTFTQIAFVLFLGASIGIIYYAFTKRNAEMFDRARSMPLDPTDPVDDAGASTGAPS